MTNVVDGGRCSCCEHEALLTPGGLLGQPICPACLFTHGLAPDVVGNLLALKQGNVVELDGSRIDLTSPLAAMLVARKLSERYRSHGASGLFDWTGRVSFPEASRRERRAARSRRRLS